MQSLSDIKGILQSSQTEEEIKSFIETYRRDERTGVIKLVESASKKIDSIEKEKRRTFEMYRYEREYGNLGLLCGIDEVGRGPLAGPVYAAAVILKPDCPMLYLNDSKKLSEKKREELYDVIMEEAISVSIGFSSCERIDEINILNATYEAMTKAVEGLDPKPLYCLGHSFICCI